MSRVIHASLKVKQQSQYLAPIATFTTPYGRVIQQEGVVTSCTTVGYGSNMAGEIS
jgi:hypothetical protein